VLHSVSPAQKSTYKQIEKLHTVAKIKTQVYKSSPNITPPLNTATKVLHKPKSQPATQNTDWQNISPHFRVVFVSDDHMVYNRP